MIEAAMAAWQVSRVRHKCPTMLLSVHLILLLMMTIPSASPIPFINEIKKSSSPASGGWISPSRISRGGSSSSSSSSSSIMDSSASSQSQQQEGEASRSMYNAQATNWVRTKPRCLSDFTGRPVVFSYLTPHLSNATVLDVGCGEGYCARRVLDLGAERVIGCDISEAMIRSATSTATAMGQSDRLSFFACPCSELLSRLEAQRDEMNVGSQVEGSMDVAMAVFLFNYLTSEETEDTMHKIHTALKPGGIFVFSVPHPSMIYCHGNVDDDDDDNESAFCAFRLKSKDKGYFSSRNEKLLGTICTVDGEELHVMSVHKTLNDYIKAINSVGFEILDIHEAGVKEEHMDVDPKFFGSVFDQPLHLIFKLRKRCRE